MDDKVTKYDLFHAMLMGIVDIETFSDTEVIIRSRGLKNDFGRLAFIEDIPKFIEEVINQRNQQKKIECEQADGVP
jgi:hypothetical protein